MHSHALDRFTHEHVFLGDRHAGNERRLWLVVGLTAAMMIAEIAGGMIFGSMALLADGWHMATHAAALGISALAYLYARRHAGDRRFAFGTGKVGELAGFASAVVLGMIALLVAIQSVTRLIDPVAIAYGQSIAIAVVGLAVNLVCAWLLRGHHDHGHDHDHHHHTDHNLKSAYLHVVADAATSVLAIGGLILAQAFAWVWIDALVGLIGAGVIAAWTVGLLRGAGAVLLDVAPGGPVERAIRDRLEIDGDRVADLHLWQVGPGHRAAVIAIVSDRPQPPSVYKERIAGLHGLCHVTVEVEAGDRQA